MNTVITGISGFVGQNLSAFLRKEDFTVNGLSLRNSWEFPQNTDAIIHLAGKAHDTSNTSDAEEYFRVNKGLTITLFNQFLQSDAASFFYFSSVKASADTVENVLDENNIPNPQTPYGKSKLEAEQYLLSQELPSEKKVFIIRPCMVHGRGNKGNLNLLYNIVEKGIPWPLASFKNERSFLSIDNLNFLIFEMLQKHKNLESGIYNFADDQALSTNDLISLISKTTGRKQKFLKISPSLIKTVAKLGDFLPLPLNSERLKKLTESYVVSNLKIKKALGIEKLPLTAQQGLEITIKSFKK